MPLDVEVMDAEPAAATPEPVAAPPGTPTEPAAPPTPPIEPAAVAAAPAAPEPEPPPKTVPLATLLAERREWQDKLNAAKAANAPPPAASSEPVAFMENPEGHIDQRIKVVTDKVAATEAELQSFRQQQQIQALVSEAGQAEAVFARDHPDYQAALDHVRSTRLAQLRLIDSETPEAQLQQIIAREEIAGIAAAKQRGINPAELAYKYAQTLGYKKAEPPPPPAAAPAAAPATLATAAADVSAARSLGAGGGGASTGDNEEESELTAALKQRFRR